MFGFLQAPAAACCGGRPKIWSGHFCGLATRLHQDYGRWSRLLINRDSTFLALAGNLATLSEGRRGTCCNPWGRQRLLFDSGPNMAFAADVTICALAVKLDDDSEDEGWARQLSSRVGLKALTGATDKASVRLDQMGFPTEEVAEILRSQSMVERSGPDAFAAAQPTATAYAQIFGFSAQLQGLAPLRNQFEEAGAALGRLIYWDDAWRDWRKDRKRGRFNVLASTPHPELREHMVHEFGVFKAQVETLPDNPVSTCMTQVVSQTEEQIPDEQSSPEEPSRTDKPWYKEKVEFTKEECCFEACARCCSGSARCGCDACC